MLLHAGVYADPLDIRTSGSPGLPITYQAAGDGVVRIDGTRLATTGGANPPAAETGWALVNGTGILSYASGNSGAVGLVNRKSGITSTVLGVFVDDYADGSWKWQNAWDTRLDNFNNTNPAFRLHDTDASHNDNQLWEDGISRVAHDWKGQFRHNVDGLNGPTDSIDLRVHDSTSPNSHSVTFTQKTDLVRISNQHDVVIDGGATRQILITRAKGLVHLTNAVACTVKNCQIKGSASGDGVLVEGGSGNLIQNNIVYGAGVAGAHRGAGIHFKAGSGSEARDNEVGYCGNQGIWVENAQSIIVRGNILHHAAEALVADTGSGAYLIEQNRIYTAGRAAALTGDLLQDMKPHPGIRLGAGANGVARRNRVYLTGHGMELGPDGPGSTQVYNNTVSTPDFDGYRLAQESAAQAGQVQNNLLQNCTSHGVGRYDFTARLYNGATGAWYGNKVRYNCFAKNTAQLRSLGDGTVDFVSTNIRTAASQAQALILPGNIVSDPLLTNPTAQDFSLQATSPCKDTGRSTDAAGANLRLLSSDVGVVGTFKDIGWSEFGGGGTTNIAPVATLSVSPASGPVPLAVTFTLGSSDADGSVASGVLDFGDGQNLPITAPPASTTRTHTYSTAGTRTATWTVTDNLSTSSLPAAATVTVTSTTPPPPTGSKIALPAGLWVADSVRLSAPQPADRVADGYTYLTNLNDPTQPTDANGFWQTEDANPAITFPHYLKGPLSTVSGRLYSLQKIRMSPTRWMFGRVYQVSVYVSAIDRSFTDPGWTPVAVNLATNASSSGAASAEWTEIGLASVQAAWIMVKFIGNSETVAPGNRVAGLWEIEAYGDPVVAPSNLPPTCTLQASPLSGVSPLAVNLTMTNSDPDGLVVEGILALDTTNPAANVVQPNPAGTWQRTNVYIAPGPGNSNYTATYQVKDDDGALSNLASVLISVGPSAPPPANQPPAAGIVATPNNGESPLAVTLSLTSGDPDGSVASGVLSYGDGTAPETITAPGGIVTRVHTYTATVAAGQVQTFTATWRVTDSGGASSPTQSAAIAVGVATPPPPPPVPGDPGGTIDQDGNTSVHYGAFWIVDTRRAADGNPLGRWSIPLRDDAGNYVSKWVRVQLGALGPIGRVRLYPFLPRTRRYTYQLELSTSIGGPWVNAFADGAASHTTGTGDFTEEIFPPRSAQFVRLTVLDVNNRTIDVASFWELVSFAG